MTPEGLQSAREEWRAGLDDVLDSDADLQRLRTRADDLKVELIRIQTPPDPTWPVSLSSPFKHQAGCTGHSLAQANAAVMMSAVQAENFCQDPYRLPKLMLAAIQG